MLGRSESLLAAAVAVTVAFVLPPLALGVFAPVTSLALALALLWALWRAPVVRLRRGGLVVAPCELVVDPSGLTFARGEMVRRRPWRAVALRTAPHALLLVLSREQVIAVPWRVIGEAGEGLIRQLMAESVQAAAFPTAVPEAMDSHRLTFRLTTSDHVAFQRWVQARGVGSWPRSLAMAGLLLLLALFAWEPWTEGLDPALGILVGLWCAGLLGVAVVRWAWPWWLTPLLVRWRLRADPHGVLHGEVRVGLGPGGGWVATSQGETAFRWSEVESVAQDEGAVYVLFQRGRGLVLPARVLGDPAALVREVRAWSAEVRRPQAAWAPTLGDATNVFAPPGD